MRGDRIDMTRCNDVAFRSGNAFLTTPTAGVFDFATLLPEDAPPLAGSIALGSFGGKVVTIDLAHWCLVIETPSSLKQRIAHGREIELRLAGEASGHAVTPFVAVKTPKGKAWMEIDTGSNSSVIVGAHNAALLGMVSDTKNAQRFQGELMGGVPLAADDAYAMPLILDSNIGTAVLQHWIVTIDVAHSRAWIASASADRKPR